MTALCLTANPKKQNGFRYNWLQLRQDTNFNCARISQCVHLSILLLIQTILKIKDSPICFHSNTASDSNLNDFCRNVCSAKIQIDEQE